MKTRTSANKKPKSISKKTVVSKKNSVNVNPALAIPLGVLVFVTAYTATRSLVQPGRVLGATVDCSQTYLPEFTPLTDMQPGQTYQGVEGGLYGPGLNSAPPSHMAKAQEANQQIVPRNAAGNPDEAGKIGLISVGFSNPYQEFIPFMSMANGDPQKSSRVVLVNGAEPSRVADKWANASDTERPWLSLATKVQNAGLSNEQVQVAWVKFSNYADPSANQFPQWAEELKGDIAVTIKHLKQSYPNLKVIYMGSRVYAGYTTHYLNPEPYAYQSGFAARWVIEDQIAGGGSSDITYSNAPVLMWGPYLWANGLGSDGVEGGIPGNSDGIEWACDDFEEDGTHPSASGENKVATILLNFFKTNELTSQWFLAGPGDPSPSPAPTVSPNPTHDPGSPKPTPSPRTGTKL